MLACSVILVFLQRRLCLPSTLFSIGGNPGGGTTKKIYNLPPPINYCNLNYIISRILIICNESPLLIMDTMAFLNVLCVTAVMLVSVWHGMRTFHIIVPPKVDSRISPLLFSTAVINKYATLYTTVNTTFHKEPFSVPNAAV